MIKYLISKNIGVTLAALLFLGAATAQEATTQGTSVLSVSEDTTAADSTAVKPFRWVALPVVAFDSDLGFQYGLLGQIFLYGDGSSYPEYKHTFYAEVSRYTKGTGINQFFYDSKYLIPGGIRTTFDFSYLTEKALNFYGFNGYQAAYHPSFEDEDSEDYISRMYYRHERKILRIIADFQGGIVSERLRWLVGVNYFNISTATVDIEKLNKGKDEEDKLPDTSLLYDEYNLLDYIAPDERDGGVTTYFKLGLVYDTRDNEAAPNRGLWTEVLFLTAPSFLGNRPYAFNKIAINHRQYITLVKNHLVFSHSLYITDFHIINIFRLNQ